MHGDHKGYRAFIVISDINCNKIMHSYFHAFGQRLNHQQGTRLIIPMDASLFNFILPKF